MKSLLITPHLLSLFLAGAYGNGSLTGDLGLSAGSNTGNTGANVDVSAKVSFGTSGRRNITNKSSSNEFYAAISSNPSTGSKARFDLKFNAQDVPRFMVNYFQKEGDVKERDSLRVALLRAIEYNNQTDALTSPYQVFLRRKNIGSQWGAFQTSVSVVSGATVIQANTTLKLSALHPLYPNLAITIESNVADVAINSPSLNISDASIKFSVYMDQFKCYLQNSRVALIAAVMTKHEVKLGGGDSQTNDDDSEVDIGSGIGHFKWQSTIMVDGKAQQVKLHPLYTLKVNTGFEEQDGDDVYGSSSTRIIAFTFPCGSAIEWDPEFGAGAVLTTGSGSDTSSAIKNVPTIFTSALALAFALMALFLL